MRRGWPLLGLNVGLDLVGIFTAALLAAHWQHQHHTFLLQAAGLCFGLGFLLVTWFLGGYSFLRWRWVPYRQFVQRWLLVVSSMLSMALLTGCQLSAPPIAAWLQPSTLLILGLVLAVCGWGLRRLLQPLAKVKASKRLAACKVTAANTSQDRHLLLLFVAYHPSQREVEQLQACLRELPPQVGYAVVVNDHHPGEPVEQLALGADGFLINQDNPGYGRAVNRLVVHLGQLPPYIGVLNTDLSWQQGTFETLLNWLVAHQDVALAVPQLLDTDGSPQHLCKQHPTLLGLFSRRFIPERFKPRWLRLYDRWYVMHGHDYSKVLDVPYLSGCCMLMRSSAFLAVEGFDEAFFLYLEDADLTRRLALLGRTVHLPEAAVTHHWGRGNHRSKWLTLVNFHSAWIYFRKWNIRLM
jgi:GT2 family glycosyltransferase